MKLAFWKKDEDETSSLEESDPLSKDFGGPGLPEPSTPAQPLPSEEIKPRFDEFSSTPKPNLEMPRDAKNYSKEDLLEAKIDAIKNKLEIFDHKLDIIISRLKDVY